MRFKKAADGSGWKPENQRERQHEAVEYGCGCLWRITALGGMAGAVVLIAISVWMRTNPLALAAAFLLENWSVILVAAVGIFALGFLMEMDHPHAISFDQASMECLSEINAKLDTVMGKLEIVEEKLDE